MFSGEIKPQFGILKRKIMACGMKGHTTSACTVHLSVLYNCTVRLHLVTVLSHCRVSIHKVTGTVEGQFYMFPSL
jgi:hypothetical protein